MTGHTAEEIRDTKGVRKLAMLTAYDFPTALALDECGLDLILVGDSLAELELGEDSTRAASLAIMAHHVRAVRNGVTRTHLVGDLPAGSYETPADAVRSARVLRAAGAESVKLEGARTDAVRAIIAAGIPVMGHVGLLPQTAGSYRRQGTTDESAERIIADAHALDAAGCYAMVVEAVPAGLGERLSAEVSVPVIGIAAGAECDGQVLTSTDLLGLLPTAPPFVTPRADGFGAAVAAGRAFAAEVRHEVAVPG